MLDLDPDPHYGKCGSKKLGTIMFNFQNGLTLLLFVPAGPHLNHRMFWNQGPGNQWGAAGQQDGQNPAITGRRAVFDS
jgi:hypothetical protein